MIHALLGTEAVKCICTALQCITYFFCKLRCWGKTKARDQFFNVIRSCASQAMNDIAIWLNGDGQVAVSINMKTHKFSGNTIKNTKIPGDYSKQYIIDPIYPPYVHVSVFFLK